MYYYGSSCILFYEKKRKVNLPLIVGDWECFCWLGDEKAYRFNLNKMPNCSESYENEISDGRNIRSIACKYCNSTILKPSTAVFATVEVQLPLINQADGSNTTTEDLSLFWLVTDMLIFENVGFSNTVGNSKYLTCADCEVGPIGYYDILTQKSYVALSRVKHC